MSERMVCEEVGVDETPGERLASATLVQILTGHVVGAETTTIRCMVCGDELHSGDIVFAVASRCVEKRCWVVPRLYCVGCAPATIESPTLGVTEALVGGRLGTLSLPTTQTHHLCLTELAVRGFSPPTER